jgi:hypothetical protein
MQTDYLWRLSQELFHLTVHSLDPSRTGQEVPERRFISHGQPTVEFCEGGTLALWHNPIETRQVSRTDALQLQLVTTFNIDLWRCWPVGSNFPPSPESIEDAVRLLQIDAIALIEGLQDGLETFASCELVQYQEVRALGPLGGMAGWRVPVTIGLSGREPGFVKECSCQIQA